MKVLFTHLVIGVCIGGSRKASWTSLSSLHHLVRHEPKHVILTSCTSLGMLTFFIFISFFFHLFPILLRYPALARLLGKNTRRFFRSSVIKGGGPTDGTVVGFLPPEADGPPLFKNLHGADGELEVGMCVCVCGGTCFSYD